MSGESEPLSEVTEQSKPEATTTSVPQHPEAELQPQSQPQSQPPAAQQPGQPGLYPPPGQQPPPYLANQPVAPYPPAPGQPGYPPGGVPSQSVGAYPYQNPILSGIPTQQAQPVTWMPMPENVGPNCPPGLEYLTQIDQLLVHQQIELIELVTNYEAENKYRIRNTLGQQVYFAKEESSVFQRQCCGPGREFSMSITDNNNREVIRLERPLRCYCMFANLTCYCCLSCCLPHIIEVQAPPGTVVGYVKQDPTGIIKPWFDIQNENSETVLKIKGPTLGCACYADADFLVLSTDGLQEVGKITKQWGGLAREYFTDADNFGIQFPMDLDIKMKAVMVGAVFLIDFMFFERAAQGGNARHHHRY